MELAEGQALAAGWSKLTRTARRLVPSLNSIRRDFQIVFIETGSSGIRILLTVRDFCHADKTTVALKDDGTVDRDQTLINEGKRQVWLMLLKGLRATEEDVLTRAAQMARGMGDE